jgi:4-aminobutyrate aminotransferase
MSISKAMGNGFPIAAFVAREEVAASFTRPSASTYGGNPVSATAALAVIDFHARHDLGARAARMGLRLREALEEISRGSRHLHSPRGLGLMIGVDVLAADGSPEQALCDSYLERLKDLGVLAGKTGPGRNVLTFLPPLTINDDELEVLVHALQEVAA